MRITDPKELNTVLLNNLISGHNMQQTIDDVYMNSGMQIALFDLNNQLLMHALGSPESRIWNFALEKGCLPDFVIDRPARGGNRLAGMFKTGNTVFFEAGEMDDCCHLCCPVYADGRPEGLLVVRFPDHKDYELAEAVSEALAKLYEYFLRSDTHNTGFDGDFLGVSFARELLLQDGDMSRSLFGEIFEMHSNDIMAKFSPGFAIAAMCGFVTGESADELKEAEHALTKFIPHSFHLISGTSILAFIYGLDGDSFHEGSSGLMTQLERFANKYHLYCGISSRFDNLQYRKNFKAQALQVLKLGRNKKPSGYVFSADSMYTDIMLSGAIERVGKEILELSDICMLAKYDAENQTNYLHTLEQYLVFGNKPSPAANSMFIDRSTMKYRLQKIQGILQKDFDQPSIAKQLRVGIAVYRLCEK